MSGVKGIHFMKCWKCGEELDKDAVFCPECGVKIKNNPPKNRISKLKLAFGIFVIAVFLTKVLGNNAELHTEQQTERIEDTEEKVRGSEREALNSVLAGDVENVAESESREEQTEQEETAEGYELETVEEETKADIELSERKEMCQVLADEEIEAEVLRIRAIFTEQMENAASGAYDCKLMENGYIAWFKNGELQTITTSAEVTSENYERIFNYENGKLIFAYFVDDGNQSRLYYKDDNIFRWSYPDTTQIYDNDFSNPDFIENGIYGRDVGYDLYRKALEEQ